MSQSLPRIARALGTMVVYGDRRGDVGHDLGIAHEIGATCIEILPEWRAYPDPAVMRARAADADLTIHSAHGCWGGQAVAADRVDLGSPDPGTWQASVDDLRSCIDWLAGAGGQYLVIHPGGLSEPEERDVRQDALLRGLATLADHATGTGVIVCVENMPPGVHPGSRMADLAHLLEVLQRAELGLALDTGHAHLGPSAMSETRAAGRWLRTTHVHDNRGRQDSHHPPGLGTIEWDAWVESLDDIGYNGPVMLECIRYLREHPESRGAAFQSELARITRQPF